MLKKINCLNQNTFIYNGVYDNDNNEIKIYFDIEKEKLEINLRNHICVGNPHLEFLTIQQTKTLASDLNLEVTIFPNSNIHFTKWNSTDELQTCYISILTTRISKYIICIAFDETQPMIYKAELLGIFEI